MYIGTKLCTVVQNYVHWYKIMYIGTKLFTVVPNSVHWYQIMYIDTKLCTVVPNDVQWYQIMYSGTKLCTVVPNFSESLVWNLLYITLLDPRILMWVLDFWKICVTLY